MNYENCKKYIDTIKVESIPDENLKGTWNQDGSVDSITSIDECKNLIESIKGNNNG